VREETAENGTSQIDLGLGTLSWRRRTISRLRKRNADPANPIGFRPAKHA